MHPEIENFTNHESNEYNIHIRILSNGYVAKAELDLLHFLEMELKVVSLSWVHF